MDKKFTEKDKHATNKPFKKGKSFQEISDEISEKSNERQPTPQPKDFDEIEY